LIKQKQPQGIKTKDMTKCIVLGEEPEVRMLKPIEFKYSFLSNLERKEAKRSPSQFENIELICRQYSTNGIFDLMFAFDEDRKYGIIYLGHWNDGVVE